MDSPEGSLLASLPPEARALVEAAAALEGEVARLRLALEVCGLVLARREPQDSWVHAAERASGAGWLPWSLAETRDDDPELAELAARNVARMASRRAGERS